MCSSDLDPFYQIRFEDGTVFRYNGDREAIIRQIAALNPGDVAGYHRFVREAERVFSTGMGLIDKPFTSLLDMVKVLPDLIRLRADRSVAGLTNKHIRDERLRQVFSFHPLLVGGNPFETTSIYTLIHHLDEGTKAVIEWIGAIGDLEPVRETAMKIGGNAKAIGLGLTVAGLGIVVSRRVKANQEGKAG